MNLSYNPVSICLFKVKYKNARKQCGISPKLTKNVPQKGCLQDIPHSDIHLSSGWESDFSGSDADSDAEL